MFLQFLKNTYCSDTEGRKTYFFKHCNRNDRVYVTFYNTTYFKKLQDVCCFWASNAIVFLKMVQQTPKHVGGNWW